MAIDVEQLIMAVAEVTNGDTLAAPVDAQGTVRIALGRLET